MINSHAYFTIVLMRATLIKIIMNKISLFISLLFSSVSLISQSGQQSDSCQGNTFIKLLGEPGTYERGIALCSAGDGNLYLTASKPDSAVLIKVNPNGQILWSRTMDFLPGYDNITWLSIDSEGMLVGSAFSCNCIQGSGSSYLFRYDPDNDKFLWVVRPVFFVSNAGDISGIIEEYPGGNYYVSFHAAVGGSSVIMEIDRQTGQEIPGTSWRYDWGANNYFRAFILHGSSIYTIGGESSDISPGNRRQSLIRINIQNGVPVWSQFNHISLNKSANLVGVDIIVDDNNLISIFSGNDEGDQVFPRYSFLQKTSLDGEIIWLKKYDLGEFLAESATEVIRVSDGYVIFGNSGVPIGSQDGLFLIKTDLNGDALWARKYDYSANDYVYTNVRKNELLEMDGFLYFTAYSADTMGGTDIVFAKLNSEGLVGGDSCAYLYDTPVETITIFDPVSENPPLTFTNTDIEFTTPIPVGGTAVPALPDFQTICSHSCTVEEACDIKTNTCVTFELLRIVVDTAGNRRYRVRFTNNCAGQNLNYLAIQVPKGTYAVGPADGETYIAESGRAYTVRNPNSSPFYSIRFKAQGQGLAQGESDVFDYTIIGQAQPDYINVFARLTPGPSYEAHLNVFNCPVEYETQNRNTGALPATASVFPNPATNQLWVTIPEAGNGDWQLFSADGKQQKTGNWQAANRLQIPVSDLARGIYFLQLNRTGVGIETIRIVKME